MIQAQGPQSFPQNVDDAGGDESGGHGGDYEVVGC